MNPHVLSVVNNFEFQQFALLVLVQIHGENECTLSMSLSPLLRLWIEEIESTDTFAHLVHHIHPEQRGKVLLFISEKSVHLRELAQVEPACVCPALLVAC